MIKSKDSGNSSQHLDCSPCVSEIDSLNSLTTTQTTHYSWCVCKVKQKMRQSKAKDSQLMSIVP